ncbi:hypothetical protein MPER_07156, partial [Moniliophthora perniciosa FA553]
APDFRDPSLCAIHDSLPGFWKMRHFPILLKAVDVAPEWLTVFLNPRVKHFLDHKRNLSAQVDKLLANKEALNVVDHETIYHHMLGPAEDDAATSRHVPLTRKDLIDEALLLLGAGSDTVGLVSTVGTFYVLQNPAIAKKLKDELRSAWPDVESPVGLVMLEKLPYLVG